jgi:hypothetical protein
MYADQVEMGVVDPLTGAGAYVPSSTPQVPMDQLTGADLDPLSGAGAYVPPSESTAAAPVSFQSQTAGLVYTPHREYQLFEAALKADKVVAKVKELSPQVPASMQLTEQEQAPGSELDNIVQVRSCSQQAEHIDRQRSAACLLYALQHATSMVSGASGGAALQGF